ncbi:uncharacterized protein YjbK [Bacillus luteolus]|nr:uncharacterized protein YjbK [Cytobacillus luteolus]
MELNQEIEIEFKNLLTKDEFQQLLTHFSVSEQAFKTQINYYFDTPQFLLKDKKSALRIRFKKNNYTLTLKQPAAIGLLETHQFLSEEQALLMINEGQFPKGDIYDILNKEEITPSLVKFFGKLTTSRAELSYKNGLLVFDHSSYLDTDDYEIEYEVSDEKSGQAHFLELLKDQGIPLRKTDNKIMRFYIKSINHGE